MEQFPPSSSHPPRNVSIADRIVSRTWKRVWTSFVVAIFFPGNSFPIGTLLNFLIPVEGEESRPPALLPWTILMILCTAHRIWRERGLRRIVSTVEFDDEKSLLVLRSIAGKLAARPIELTYEGLSWRVEIPKGVYAKPLTALHISHNGRLVATLHNRSEEWWGQDLKNLREILESLPTPPPRRSDMPEAPSRQPRAQALAR